MSNQVKPKIDVNGGRVSVNIEYDGKVVLIRLLKISALITFHMIEINNYTQFKPYIKGIVT